MEFLPEGYWGWAGGGAYTCPSCRASGFLLKKGRLAGCSGAHPRAALAHGSHGPPQAAARQLRCRLRRQATAGPPDCILAVPSAGRSKARPPHGRKPQSSPGVRALVVRRSAPGRWRTAPSSCAGWHVCVCARAGSVVVTREPGPTRLLPHRTLQAGTLEGRPFLPRGQLWLTKHHLTLPLVWLAIYSDPAPSHSWHQT